MLFKDRIDHVVLDDMLDSFAVRSQIFKQMLEAADLKAHHHILDAGIGGGGLLFQACHYVDRGEAHGLDIASDMIDFCQHKINTLEELRHVQLHRGAVQDMHFFPANRFDIIFNGGVLHEVMGFGIDDVLKTAKEFNRILKPGGSLIVYDFTKHEDNVYVPFETENPLVHECLDWLLNNPVGKTVSAKVLDGAAPFRDGNINLNLVYEILWRVRKESFDIDEEIHFGFTLQELTAILEDAGFATKVVYRELDDYQRAGLLKRLRDIDIRLDEHHFIPHRAVIKAVKNDA